MGWGKVGVARPASRTVEAAPRGGGSARDRGAQDGGQLGGGIEVSQAEIDRSRVGSPRVGSGEAGFGRVGGAACRGVGGCGAGYRGAACHGEGAGVAAGASAGWGKDNAADGGVAGQAAGGFGGDRGAASERCAGGAWQAEQSVVGDGDDDPAGAGRCVVRDGQVAGLEPGGAHGVERVGAALPRGAVVVGAGPLGQRVEHGDGAFGGFWVQAAGDLAQAFETARNRQVPPVSARHGVAQVAAGVGGRVDLLPDRSQRGGIGGGRVRGEDGVGCGPQVAPPRRSNAVTVGRVRAVRRVRTRWVGVVGVTAAAGVAVRAVGVAVRAAGVRAWPGGGRWQAADLAGRGAHLGQAHLPGAKQGRHFRHRGKHPGRRHDPGRVVGELHVPAYPAPQ